jgi:hypothetical protein
MQRHGAVADLSAWCERQGKEMLASRVRLVHDCSAPQHCWIMPVPFKGGWRMGWYAGCAAHHNDRR